MRILFVVLFFSCAFIATAQDAAQQMQIDQQTAQQFTQQAASNAQQAASQAQQDSQLASQNAQAMALQAFIFSGCNCPAKPRFSLKHGTYSSAINVQISDPAPHAVIHYTTDGTKPTALSALYVEPVLIASTTKLRAVAIAPHHNPSPIASAVYKLRTVDLSR